jgi:hypothetical protein
MVPKQAVGEIKARSVQRPTDLRIIRTAPFMKLSRQRRLCAGG